ncbi:MAG: pilus assembly protein [Salinisphaeraceae bacterium]|nr:pilus assembly protein [Salinisphaeraceae bacterium]
MSPLPQYIVDSDVFISAKNAYYAFDICPGFWDSLIFHYQRGSVGSIDAVRRELLAGRKTEDLVLWVKNQVPADFFDSTEEEDVIEAYSEIMLWAQRHPQYFDRAKAKFATEADGWLVAYAMAHGGIVVTQEQPSPDSKNRILLPDVCNQFGVAYQDTFLMLKALEARFVWEGGS